MILTEIQGKNSGKSEKQARKQVADLHAAIWEQYLAVSFERLHILTDERRSHLVQYAQRLVVTELLKVLYNPVLTVEQKVELIATAQELF